MLETGLYHSTDVTWSIGVLSTYSTGHAVRDFDFITKSIFTNSVRGCLQPAPFKGTNTACEYDRTFEAKALTSITMVGLTVESVVGRYFFGLGSATCVGVGTCSA